MAGNLRPRTRGQCYRVHEGGERVHQEVSRGQEADLVSRDLSESRALEEREEADRRVFGLERGRHTRFTAASIFKWVTDFN